MAKYKIDPARSRLWAEARSSLHPIKCETSDLEGEIVADFVDGRPDPSSPPKGKIEIEASSLKTGNGLYDRELERRLEVRRYPRLRGEVREVRALDDGRYHVKGELSFHGKTVAVEGDVTLKVIDEKTVEVSGEQTFDMRQFGLDPPNLIVVRVYPDIKVRARVVAEKV